MKRSPNRKFIFYFLFFIFSLGNLIRYKEFIGIENGSPDSWEYHLQTNQIINEGEISWASNVLSYYGLYPPYVEVGIETYLASLAIVFAMDTTYSMLILCSIIFHLSVLFMFLVGRELFGTWTGLFSSLVFSCSPMVFQSTVWGIQQRLFFAIFVLVIIFYIIKIMRSEKRFRNISLLIVSLIAISSLHKTFLFIIFILINGIVANVLLKLLQITNNQFFNYSSFKNHSVFFGFALLLSIFLVGAQINKASDDNYFEHLIYLIKEISMDLGIPIVFGFIGFKKLFELKLKKEILFFIVTLYVGLVINLVIPPPRGLIREPVSFFTFFPFYFLVIGLGISDLSNIFNRKFILPVKVLVLSIMIISPTFIQVSDLDNNSILEENNSYERERYLNLMSTSMYVKYKSTDGVLHIGKVPISVILSHSGNNFFTDQENLLNLYSDYEWSLDNFLGSRKAEGFQNINAPFLSDTNSLSYVDKEYSEQRVQADFKSLRINMIVLSNENDFYHDSKLVLTINDEIYTLYSDNSVQILFHNFR